MNVRRVLNQIIKGDPSRHRNVIVKEPELEIPFFITPYIAFGAAVVKDPLLFAILEKNKLLPGVAPQYFVPWVQTLMLTYLKTWGSPNGFNGLMYYVPVRPESSMYETISVSYLNQQYGNTESLKLFSWNGLEVPEAKRIDKGVMEFAREKEQNPASMERYNPPEIAMINRATQLITVSVPQYVEYRKQQLNHV